VFFFLEIMTIVTLEVGSPTNSAPASIHKDKYAEASFYDIIRERSGWLLFFFGGLLAAAFVVEIFEAVLKEHVELSYFVPLLIGHGGNTGAQSNATIIRCACRMISLYRSHCMHSNKTKEWGRGGEREEEEEEVLSFVGCVLLLQ